MQTIRCEDCAGRGVDPGSLREPEACQECGGAGYKLHPQEIARIALESRVRSACRSEPVKPGYFEERMYRFGS